MPMKGFNVTWYCDSCEAGFNVVYDSPGIIEYYDNPIATISPPYDELTHFEINDQHWLLCKKCIEPLADLVSKNIDAKKEQAD